MLPELIKASPQSPSCPTGSAAGRNDDLDLSQPVDNLYAFAKLWSTLADEPIQSSFHGVMFAYIEGRKSVPLFPREQSCMATGVNA